MTWYPMDLLPRQYVDANGDPYSGAVLKTYAAGTSTPVSMATDYTGDTQATSFPLNANGYAVSGSSVITPSIDQNYKIVLYPDQDSADANSGALWSVDNIQIASSSSATIFQSLSGDGTTTEFTLSNDLGTDSSNIIVFVDSGLVEHTTNGSFASDTGWTKDVNTTIATGVATIASTDTGTALTQSAAQIIIEGESYNLTYTITRSAGSIIPSIGGTSGTSRSSAATYTETIIAGATQAIAFTTSGFTGTVDNVSVTPTRGIGMQVLNPSAYTLANTTLIFETAPANGSNNIFIFAPSLLASSAATISASASATAAAASETSASANAILSEAWATTLDAEVSAMDYSAKEYAIGDTVPAGSAKYWAGEAAAIVGASAATGSELDTGTDISDWATAKALKDSHNIPSVAPGTSGNILTSDGTDWTSAAPASPTATHPTSQYLITGLGATYTTPADCTFIRVRMWGGGGGGGAAATNNGTAGGDTIFNSIHATGGGAGNAPAASKGTTPGIGGVSGTGSATFRMRGASGMGGHGTASGSPGGEGGCSSSGGNGYGVVDSAGTAAVANSGSGGGGGAAGSNNGGTGGGAGEYVIIDIPSPSSTYTYTIGAAGIGGSAGTNAGGNGGTGMIIVEEYYA